MRIIIFIMLFTFSYNLSAQKKSLDQIYEIGNDFFQKKEYNKALPILLEVAKEGHSDSQFLVGKIYHKGLGVEVDYSKALEWYNKAAEQGNAKAYNNIGCMYYDGLGVDKNTSEAFNWFFKAAEKGIDTAQYTIGCYYYYDDGDSVPQDIGEAKKWFEKAALQDYSQALYHLGVIYFKEYGSFKDKETAARYFKKAADQGLAEAQYYLGYMYRDGEGVKQDYKEAVRLLTKAAKQGHYWAQINLGFLYHEGKGITRDDSKCAYWFKKAAEKDDSYAHFLVGWCYFYGVGVKKDMSEGLWIIRKEAENGLSQAQCNLGIIYEKGLAVSRNQSEAIAWYKKALTSDPNNKVAQEALTRLGVRWDLSGQKESSSPDPTNRPSTQIIDNSITFDASGSGFVIDKRGYLATNHHVTKGARAIYVCLQKDGVWKSYYAVQVKNDPTNDLSIIRIDDSEFEQFDTLPYNFSTETQDVASEIYTLGYPRVNVMGTDVKYNPGTINSKSGIQGDPTHYQISAHIDYGNSGGPMFNNRGEIIGITDGGLNKAEFGDVNYAIKSSYLKTLVDALPVKLDLPHDASIEKLSRIEQIKILSQFTALILIDLQ